MDTILAVVFENAFCESKWFAILVVFDFMLRRSSF